jgi:molybdopterin-guanine dinucleotide biosynthesis protein A
MSRISTVAYILAGGKSRRMGQDKLFAEACGQTLIGRVVLTCRSRFESVKLVAKDVDRFDSLPYEVVIDWPHAQGPLAGIISALLDCPDEACFISAADLYDLSSDTIDSLIGNYRGEDYLGVSENGRIQPLCGIYGQSALDRLQAQALDGEYGAIKAVEGLNARTIDVAVTQWRNINTRTDLESIGGRL